MDGKLGLSVLD